MVAGIVGVTTAMKPHDLNRTKKSRAVAQARMLLKSHLAWLRGYPVGWQAGRVSWMVPAATGAAAAPLVIDGAVLSAAQRASNELLRDFRAALAETVGDPDEWTAGVDRLLGWIKRGIHARSDRAAMPSSLFGTEPAFGSTALRSARAIVAATPAVAPVVAALSWMNCATPEQVGRALQRLAVEAAGLMGITPYLPDSDAALFWLRLDETRLASDGDAFAPFASALLDPALHTTPRASEKGRVDQLAATVRALLKGHQPSEIPPSPRRSPTALAAVSDGPRLVKWLEWLREQDASTRNRALALLAAADPMVVVRRWASWWETLFTDEQRIEQLRARVRPGRRPRQDIVEELGAIRRRLLDHSRVTPDPVPIDKVLRAATTFADARNRSAGDAVLEVLRWIPESHGGRFLRLCMLVDFAAYLVDFDGVGTRLASFLRHLRGTLAQAGDGRGLVLMPWVDALARDRRTIIPRFIGELPDGATQARFCAALASHSQAQGGGVGFDGAVRLAEIVPFASSPEIACQSLQRWQATSGESFVPRGMGRAAARMCVDDAAQFPAVLHALRSFGADAEAIQSLVGPFDSSAGRAWLRRALLDDLAAPLREAARRAQALQAAGRSLPAAPVEQDAAAVPPWARDFPATLHAPLARLAAAVPDAEEIAGDVLGPGFRAPASIRRELEVLRDRAGAGAVDARIARRIERLSALLVERAAVGPVRLARLAAKVDRFARRTRLEAWIRALDAELDLALAPLLGISRVPAEWRSDRRLKCLLPIVRLPSDARRLARLILEARLGPPPWDLRDHPANARFVDELRRRGVSMEPWLDGIPARTERIPGDGGGALKLALEDDPLELLEMGAHFSTCLSPDGVNYFSVFANLADINKRVLYARDHQGRVFGRCLLALTAGGGLVTFHPYCHGNYPFGAMVRGFVGALARAMGVTMLPRGTVPLLVARDWYDDGPTDLGERFPCLAEGSAFRLALGAITPAEFPSLLESALAPIALNELTFPVVAALPELQVRPALLVALAPRIAAMRDLPVGTLMEVAETFGAAGRLDLLEGAIGEALLRAFRPTVTQSWFAPSVLGLLAAVDPSGTLRLLRDTRDRGVRTWDDEESGERLFAAAEAMRLLGRPKQAMALYRKAVATDPGTHTRDRCRVQLRALKGKVAARPEQ